MHSFVNRLNRSMDMDMDLAAVNSVHLASKEDDILRQITCNGGSLVMMVIQGHRSW